MAHKNESDQIDGARRRVLKGLAVSGAALAAGDPARAAGDAQTTADSTLTFPEVRRALDTELVVSEGHTAQVLMRWGDAVVSSAPAWTPLSQSKDAQALQFGYDNDFLAFVPLPYGSGSSTHGLLCVNHESARSNLMFPDAPGVDALSRTQMDVEIAAHGMSVVEIRLEDGAWKPVADSKLSRRYTGFDTFTVTGPAAGHPRLRTFDDATGTKVIGTLNNCAGGVTPWGTVLSGEENIHHYFLGKPTGAEAANHEAMGLGTDRFHGWHKFYPRFELAREPHEPNRFGWVVEIDPYDPTVPPVKRTALGRFRHEGASVVRNPDGRVVVYMGDDQMFEHVYKFVSRDSAKTERAQNRDLLDHGTLYAARFEDDGRLRWLPLVHGEGPLTAANGFASQADVLIEVRRAAKLVGATPMDRAEDLEVHPSGSVFVALTKNARREGGQVDAANPRARNRHGHVLEFLPPGGPGADPDHAAVEGRWRPLFFAGNPEEPASGARYHAGTSDNGWMSNPDNFAIDPKGRLWISSDGANDFGLADGIWVTDVEGPGRALTRHFLRVPVGGEATGPTFTPDGTTFFVSVQHPGASDGSTFAAPSTRWPDFDDTLPPRPSVVAIRRKDGQPLG